MATGSPASGRGDIQCIVVADVAQIAGDRRMTIGEWKTRRAVIENSRGPCGDRMARGALCRRCRKSRRYMVRNAPTDRRGADEIGLMASIAVR